MGSPREDWIAVLEALERGDQLALAKMTGVITSFLARYGAYEFRDTWDDLCQEVLIALIRSARRGSIREPGAFISYTGTVTRNKLLDWVERQQRPGRPDPHGEPENAAATSELERMLSERRDAETLVDLHQALAKLPERHRQVLESIYLQGHTYEEAAAQRGMPLGTLKRLQTQGLRMLRQKMRIPGEVL